MYIIIFSILGVASWRDFSSWDEQSLFWSFREVMLTQHSWTRHSWTRHSCCTFVMLRHTPARRSASSSVHREQTQFRPSLLIVHEAESKQTQIKSQKGKRGRKWLQKPLENKSSIHHSNRGNGAGNKRETLRLRSSSWHVFLWNSRHCPLP